MTYDPAAPPFPAAFLLVLYAFPYQAWNWIGIGGRQYGRLQGLACGPVCARPDTGVLDYAVPAVWRGDSER
jgi:hypothetical protein